MKQTLQSILTASNAVLFPAISRNHSLNSVFCITESDVFRCNEEIAVFLQDPDFQNRLCKQDFVDVLFILKGNCTCRFYKTDLTTPPESVFFPDIPFVLSHIRLFILFLLIPTARFCIFFSGWIL